LSFAILTNSARSFAGLSGLVTRASGLEAAMATVAKSSGLNGFVWCSVALMASAVVVTSSV
jgi:hypothetical protein